MKVLYFVPSLAGISGDMTLAALVDLGLDPQALEAALFPLSPLLPIRLGFDRVDRCGLSALKLTLLEPLPLFEHHYYKEIKVLIESALLPPRTEALALAFFERIAVAEAKIHGVKLEEVHFHEVAAIDSIVDLVGTAVAIGLLEPDLVLFSPLALGYGEVVCSHGVYPVPALATLEILKEVPVRSGNLPFELTTPTGAAIAKELAQGFSEGLPAMRVSKIGYGAGTRELPNRPNVLRVVLGELEGEWTGEALPPSRRLKIKF